MGRMRETDKTVRAVISQLFVVHIGASLVYQLLLYLCLGKLYHQYYPFKLKGPLRSAIRKQDSNLNIKESVLKEHSSDLVMHP